MYQVDRDEDQFAQRPQPYQGRFGGIGLDGFTEEIAGYKHSGEVQYAYNLVENIGILDGIEKKQGILEEAEEKTNRGDEHHFHHTAVLPEAI